MCTLLFVWACTSSAMRFAAVGSSVVWSTSSVPALVVPAGSAPAPTSQGLALTWSDRLPLCTPARPLSSPPSPRYTASTCGVEGSMVKTRAASAATSEGLATRRTRCAAASPLASLTPLTKAAALASFGSQMTISGISSHLRLLASAHALV